MDEPVETVSDDHSSSPTDSPSETTQCGSEKNPQSNQEPTEDVPQCRNNSVEAKQSAVSDEGNDDVEGVSCAQDEGAGNGEVVQDSIDRVAPGDVQDGSTVCDEGADTPEQTTNSISQKEIPTQPETATVLNTRNEHQVISDGEQMSDNQTSNSVSEPCVDPQVESCVEQTVSESLCPGEHTSIPCDASQRPSDNQREVEDSVVEQTSNQAPTLNDDDNLLSELERELGPSPTHKPTNCLPNGLSKSSLPSDAHQLQLQLLSVQNSLQSRSQQCKTLTDEKDHLLKVLEESETQRKLLDEKLKDALSVQENYSTETQKLEQAVAEQQKEVKELTEKLSVHDTAAKRAIGTLQSELKSRVDTVTRQYEECRREKEDMVMKFALAEQKNIDVNERMARMEAHVREVAREREAMLVKFKQLKSEKIRLSENFDAKNGEIAALKKEVEKQKDLVETQEVKGRWAQNKLKAEQETHKETKARVDELQRKLKEAKEECEQIRRDCQAMIRTYQESEEIKSNSLDQRLKETKTQLIAEQQERSDQRDIATVTLKELEQLKRQHREVVVELANCKDKVQCLDAERICLEQSVEQNQQTIQAQRAEIRDKDAKLVKFKDVSKNLFRAQEDAKKFEEHCKELEQTIRELTEDINSCSKRETQHLEFTSKLTDKNALLESENTALNSKVKVLAEELENAFVENDALKSKLKTLEEAFESEKRSRIEETENLSSQLQHKSTAVEELTIQLDDERDSIKTLKRRHQANIKDLTRQLLQAKKKLEGSDSPRTADTGSAAGSMGSRTSSTNSLDTTGTRGASQEPQVTPTQEDSPPLVEYVEVDKQLLLDKIVKLQKSHARKNDKIEFLEDHINQLLTEVQRKAKIIQWYAVREESGVLAPETSDFNKAAMVKKGGIMASVFSEHSQDGAMSLDLSLQITRKLQTVLEDTLLKNITLKENIDTLGQEIAKLSQDNRKLELSLLKR